LLMALACTKEEPVIIPSPAYCWDCYKNVTFPGSSVSMKITVCDFTSEQIKDFIKQNTDTTGTTIYTMKCTIK
jgi:hypothetical protein